MKSSTNRRLYSLVAIIFFSFCTLTPSFVHAGAWGEDFEAAILKQMLEKIQKQIDGLLLGTLKSTAISLLNTRVASLVGGSSKSASLVISDWRAYLYQEPGQKSLLAYDAFKSATLKGRSSGFSSATGGQSYESYLEKFADNHVLASGAANSTTLLSELSSDPIKSADDGDFRVISAMYASESDPIGYALRAEKAKMIAQSQYQNEAELKAMSSGYKGVQDKAGNTILPGSTIGQMVADVQDIGNKVIASAQNPTELVGGVITTLANRMITNLIQSGLGKVQASIQREITNVDSQIMSQVDVVNRQLGRGAAYTSGVRQQVNVNLNAAGSGAAMPILSGN
jgi:hypothetical protein